MITLGTSLSANAKIVGTKLTNFFQSTTKTNRNSLEVKTGDLGDKRDEDGFYDFESKTPTTPSVENVVKQKATISIGKKAEDKSKVDHNFLIVDDDPEGNLYF